MIEAISASWCVWSPGVFHITGTTTRQLNSQIKTPTNPTYEPIVDLSSSATTTVMASLSSLSLSFAFLLAIVGIGFVGVFTTRIVGGILLPSSHRHRAEAEISPSPTTWNEQDGDDLWVTKQRGLGFSRFIWNRFLISGRCTLFVGFQQVCL